MAVGAEAVFEEFDACAQVGVLFLQNDNLPLQSRDQRENGVGSLVIERLECVACAHIGFHESQTQRFTPMLRVFCPKMGRNSYEKLSQKTWPTLKPSCVIRRKTDDKQRECPRTTYTDNAQTQTQESASRRVWNNNPPGAGILRVGLQS